MAPTQRTPNRLAKEASPYLLQHARNPVDWFPWGREALYVCHGRTCSLPATAPDELRALLDEGGR